MYKSCSKCGKIHRAGEKCRTAYISKPTDEKKQRSRYAWTKKSTQVREDSNYLCAVCRDRGVYNYNNVEVHHIKKLREGGGLLEDDNLICLCVEHHKQADRGELSDEYLRQLSALRTS